MFDRISFDPQVMGGRACIRGTRILVASVVSRVAHRSTVDEILSDYPALKPEDVQEALEYAAWLTREEVVAR